ncbi:hypothetical protein IFM89_010541 [Coptis chinensis]|uniref:CCD97-like C-terminal domain-containing protein n=1 Tax=Coptis chinensis TaxID=261450 RepID=A0A835IVX2_9MAGN|nr:hypothetical protein IFM89_010541 [Coptis chinensis]
MESIAERLSGMDNLYFPRSIGHVIDSPQRKSILLDLLSKDAAVFLERYGELLTGEELNEFDVKKSDYEVNWHLNKLRSLMNPTVEDVRLRSVKVKNRRRAYMSKLVIEGNYFSEDSMREREPYLHHEFVGKFQDPSGRSMARPGEKWSETLMRRCEEAVLVDKIRGEQQRLGVDQRDWTPFNLDLLEYHNSTSSHQDKNVKNVLSNLTDFNGLLRYWMEFQEPDNNDPSNGVRSNGTESNEKASLSAVEMQDQMEQFTHVMQQKFLSGKDSHYLDYSIIDNDETLDDHWLREANHDAEEKYFADD